MQRVYQRLTRHRRAALFLTFRVLAKASPGLNEWRRQSREGTMTETYPRDMIGYGRNPPDPKWPDDAVVAVQFVVNYEEGGENNILHGDAASEAFLSEIVGAQPWPGMRHMNMESIYEYGSRAGFWRLWRMFTGRNIPVTVYGVATALARNPEAVAAMKEADWEIASHGLKWIDYRDYTKDAERAAHGRGDPHPYRDHRRPAARLVHRPLVAPLNRSCRGGGRLPLFFRRLCRRSAVLDQRAARAVPDHPLHARRQRHAVRDAAGVQRRRPVPRPTSPIPSTRSTPRARPARRR